MPDSDSDPFAIALGNAVADAVADSCPFCNAHAHVGYVPIPDRQLIARAHLDAHAPAFIDPHADDDPTADTAY